jgi:hypothetical protein
MNNIPCPECGAKTDGYCPNCQFVTAHVHQWRATPSVMRELKSLCLGLAKYCEEPTATIGDVVKGLKELRLCDECGLLYETPTCPNKCNSKVLSNNLSNE